MRRRAQSAAQPCLCLLAVFAQPFHCLSFVCSSSFHCRSLTFHCLSFVFSPPPHRRNWVDDQVDGSMATGRVLGVAARGSAVVLT